MSYAIQTFQLSKNYGRVQAVRDLSLGVHEGEIYAFLGLNGAGKTTTIRMLLGMIRPMAGSVTVLGERVRPGVRSPWAQVGYLVETARGYPELTVRENLEAQRKLHPGVAPAAVSEMIERLSLCAYADRRAGTLSLGNLQRLGLAKALLHRPRLLLLDEPANGLDPAGIVEIRELLIGLAREHGTTVFLSSHILAEVARLAQRVGILHRGVLLREFDAGALEAERRQRLLVQSRDLAAARQVLEQAGLCPAVSEEGCLELTEQACMERPDEIAVLLTRAGHPPTRLLVEQENLEAYFLRLVGAEQGAAQ